jgi:hypothetical protein
MTEFRVCLMGSALYYAAESLLCLQRYAVWVKQNAPVVMQYEQGRKA